jgi:hypothetical protein
MIASYLEISDSAFTVGLSAGEVRSAASGAASGAVKVDCVYPAE